MPAAPRIGASALIGVLVSGPITERSLREYTTSRAFSGTEAFWIGSGLSRSKRAMRFSISSRENWIVFIGGSGPSSLAHSQIPEQAFAAREPPSVLLGPLREFRIDAEREGRVHRPVRIEQRLPADGDQVGTARLQRVLCLLRRENQAHSHGGDAGFLFHFFRERQLKAG